MAGHCWSLQLLFFLGQRAVWLDQLVGAYYGPKKLLQPVKPRVSLSSHTSLSQRLKNIVEYALMTTPSEGLKDLKNPGTDGLWALLGETLQKKHFIKLPDQSSVPTLLVTPIHLPSCQTELQVVPTHLPSLHFQAFTLDIQLKWFLLHKILWSSKISVKHDLLYKIPHSFFWDLSSGPKCQWNAVGSVSMGTLSFGVMDGCPWGRWVKTIFSTRSSVLFIFNHPFVLGMHSPLFRKHQLYTSSHENSSLPPCSMHAPPSRETDTWNPLDWPLISPKNTHCSFVEFQFQILSVDSTEKERSVLLLSLFHTCPFLLPTLYGLSKCLFLFCASGMRWDS